MLIDSQFPKRFASALKKARAERIRCVRLRAGLFYVARKDTKKAHGEYLVTFSLIPSVNGQDRVTAQCREINGGSCKGTWQGRCCAHIAVSYLRSIKRGRQAERKQAA